MTQQQILSGVRDGTVFGMIECDICVPEELRDYFAEMQPVFKNISLIREDLGPFMRRYAEEHNIMTIPRRMLVGSYYGDKILLATPLLRWYLDHGLEVLHVYQVVEYDPIPCFHRFGDAVSEARRAGDVHRDRAIIADTMKLCGKLGLRKNHQQRGSASRHQLLHGEGGVAPGQQSSIPATRRRRRRRVRDRDEQENSDVCLAYTRGILRSAVRQDAHAAVLLRLHRQIRGASSVPILRDGYG